MSAQTRYAEVKQHENHNIYIGILIGIMAMVVLVAVSCCNQNTIATAQVEHKPEPLYPHTRISPLEGVYYNMGSLDGETWIVIDKVNFITNHSEIPATDAVIESLNEKKVTGYNRLPQIKITIKNLKKCKILLLTSKEKRTVSKNK